MNPLTSPSPFVLRALPDNALAVLAQTDPPPRLLAHLRLVHDAAIHFCEQLHQRHLLDQADTDALLFGAATHDIGKVLVPDELIGPGHTHERRGQSLLLDLNVPPELARFAKTHGSWRSDTAMPLEDLVVALADTSWKGQRDSELEQRITTLLVATTAQEPWKVWSDLDEMLEAYSADATERLLWQAQFSAR